MTTPLAGKVALVTGGARGIGRGIALALAGAGADVAIADIDTLPPGASQYGDARVSGFEKARETAAEIAKHGRRAIAVTADVTRKADCAQMVAETEQLLGGLDVLVCNAGVVSIAPIAALDEATWDLTFAVNAKGVFLSCQAAIPALARRGGGAIVNIASVAGKNGVPGLAHYCASKAAVVLFTNALAKELAPANVRVNAICPGILRTQMWEYLAETLKQPGETRDDSWQRYVRQFIPLGRPQTPDDIGQAAVYLATAPNVTGQAVNVDGGIELH
jgi:meso-butanediol dehydrogenase/(S,S)-butanediol dehydrogenase/diacetyl reductase